MRGKTRIPIAPADAKNTQTDYTTGDGRLTAGMQQLGQATVDGADHHTATQQHSSTAHSLLTGACRGVLHRCMQAQTDRPPVLHARQYDDALTLSHTPRDTYKPPAGVRRSTWGLSLLLVCA